MANPILESLQARLDQTEARYHPGTVTPPDLSMSTGRVYRDPLTGTAKLRPLGVALEDSVPIPAGKVAMPPSVSVPRNDFNAMILKLLISIDDKLNTLVSPPPPRKKRCVTSSPPSSGASGN